MVEEHRPALAYDFRHSFGLSIHEIGKSLGYGEAVDLVEQLLHEQGSHVSMSLHGWDYPASRSDIQLMAVFAKLVNMNQPEGSTPFSPAWPWPSEADEAEVSADELAESKAILAANSAFG